MNSSIDGMPRAGLRATLRTELAAYWRDVRPRFIHAVKVAGAAVLALGICMRLELRTPATAMVSVVIVMMHQQSGMVIARGFYRGLGMVCGSVAGLILLALFPQQPHLFLLALAGWIGFCVFAASYYRNFQSYGFVLSGYATCITAIPAWSNPYGVFDNIVFSVSEVAIGVVCACAISALVLPNRITPVLIAANQRNVGNLLNAIRAMLAKGADGAIGADLDACLALIQERTQVDSLRSAAVFEDPSVRLHNHALADLDRSFLDTLARLHALHQIRRRIPAAANARVRGAVDDLLASLVAVVPNPMPVAGIGADRAQALLGRLDGLVQALGPRLEALLVSLQDLPVHERQFVATAGSAVYFTVTDLQLLCRSFIAAHTRDSRPWTLSLLDAFGHVDRTRATANRTAAAVTGLRAGTAVLVVGAAWIASGWQGGSSAIVAVAITCSLFALAPNPLAASKQIFVGCVAGGFGGFLFTFLLLPMLGGFALLEACIAIYLMVGSYVNTFPRFGLLGLGFNIYFCFISGLSNPMVYNPAGYLDTMFGLMLGIATAAVAFALVVPHAGDWVTAQYLRQIRGLVSAEATASVSEDPLYGFEISVRDFITSVSSGPADARVNRAELIGWAFAALEIGRAMIQVRMDTERLGPMLPAGWQAMQADWLAAIAGVFDAVTPQSTSRALAVTRQALAAVPLQQSIGMDPKTLARFRLRALLHFTEMTLEDKTLPLWRVTGAAT